MCEPPAANRHAALFYAEYDPAARCLTYVNAGHSPPLVLRNGSGPSRVLPLFPQQHYQRGVFSHQPDDLIVLFIDGVSESMNVREEEWGEDNLIELAKTCHGLPTLAVMRRILAAAHAFATGAPQHDDMTLVVLRGA